MAQSELPIADLKLPEAHRVAGVNYLRSIKTLGLHPSGLLWAWDKTIEQWALVLITDQMEMVGPSEVFRMLFIAYNKSATPKEVSPFIIRLHSTVQDSGRSLLTAVRALTDGRMLEFMRADPEVVETIRSSGPLKSLDTIIEIGDLAIDAKWVYEIERVKVSHVDLKRQWRRFTENILAAA